MLSPKEIQEIYPIFGELKEREPDEDRQIADVITTPHLRVC